MRALGLIVKRVIKMGGILKQLLAGKLDFFVPGNIKRRWKRWLTVTGVVVLDRREQRPFAVFK